MPVRQLAWVATLVRILFILHLQLLQDAILISCIWLSVSSTTCILSPYVLYLSATFLAVWEVAFDCS